MAAPKIARSLADLGFTPATSNVQRRLIISSQGMNKSGKTNFALTAPKPIAVFDVDVGLEGVVGKHTKTAKDIMVREFSLPPEGDEQKEAQALVKEFEMAFTAVCKLPKSECASIVWDSGTEIWELERMAAFGKLSQVMPHQYVGLNSQFRKLLRLIADTDKNFVITHKMKKEYVDKVDAQGRKVQVASGEWIRAGFADIGYVVQINLDHRRVDGKFETEILDCRQDGDIGGFVMDQRASTFTELATMVFPDTKPADWR